MYLARNPLCVHCERVGRMTSATVVDHVIPHRGDRNLFWDMANWQALDADCHARKGARESGLARCNHNGAILRIGKRNVCVLCGRFV
jgi:5-methylcytosine-specific restriction endonuclease McrA